MLGKTATEAQEHPKAQKRKKKQEAGQKKKAEAEAEAEAKKQKEQDTKNEAIKKVSNYIEPPTPQLKTKLSEDFYDDSEGSWMGSFPIDRGQDPRTAEHGILQSWFFDFIAENQIGI